MYLYMYICHTLIICTTCSVHNESTSHSQSPINIQHDTDEDRTRDKLKPRLPILANPNITTCTEYNINRPLPTDLDNAVKSSMYVLRNVWRVSRVSLCRAGTNTNPPVTYLKRKKPPFNLRLNLRHLNLEEKKRHI